MNRFIKPATLLFTAFMLLSGWAKPQSLGIGAAAIYNPQTESVGLDARASLLPNQRLSIVPQVTYYPSFNKIHEYYIGIGAEYDLIPLKKFTVYALAHGAYNGWINHEESAMQSTSFSNWNLEAGGGISTNSCLRPFAEYRYNARFKETNVRVGVLYLFGCISSGGHGHGRAIDQCPAYQ